MDRKIRYEFMRSFWKMALCILLTGVSCSRNQEISSKMKTLDVHLFNQPISLDPTFTQDGVSLQVLNNMSEGLVGYDEEGNLQNRLAESYTISPDGKHYDFTLRSGVKWSDGQDVRGEDFVVAFRRALGPNSTSQLAHLLFSIRGARAHQGKAPAQKLGVTARKNHLFIDLEQKTPYFIHALSLPVALPLRQDVLDAHQGAWPENAPVTGPYRLVAHQMDQKIRLEKNPNYWGKPPTIDAVNFWIVAEETTAMNLFDQGRLDILMRIPALDFPKLRDQGKVVTTPFLATYYLSFNCKRSPFTDRNWRRAIAGVIKKQEIIGFLGAGERAAWSWIPFGLDGYLPYRDPVEVFADAVSWAKKQKISVDAMTLGFDSGSRNSRIIEKIQEDIHKGLGLKLATSQADWKSYLRILRTDPPAVFRYGWMAPFNDPVVHLKVFVSGDLNNFSGFSNAQYDRLIGEIEKMDPGPERTKKIVSAEKILLEDEAAVVPLFHYVQNTAVSARVKNLKINNFGIILFKNIDLN